VRNPFRTPSPEPTPGADSTSTLHDARRRRGDVVLATFQSDFLLICTMELSFAANVRSAGPPRKDARDEATSGTGKSLAVPSTLGKRRSQRIGGAIRTTGPRGF
jgi:hypothetical protein